MVWKQYYKIQMSAVFQKSAWLLMWQTSEGCFCSMQVAVLYEGKRERKHMINS